MPAMAPADRTEESPSLTGPCSTLSSMEIVGSAPAVADCEAGGVPDGDCVPVMGGVPDGDCVPVVEGVPDGDCVPVLEGVPDGDCVPVMEGVPDGDCVPVLEGVPDGDCVPVMEGVPDGDCVPVTEGVQVTEGVRVADGVEDTLGLPETEGVPLGEAEGVGELDELAEHRTAGVGRALCTTSVAFSSGGYTMEWAGPGCSQPTAPMVTLFPRPSSPLGDAPQHTTAPTRSVAQVCVSPADTDATRALWGMRTVLALTGVPPAPTSVLLPYPRRPSSPSPQHVRVKSSSTAQVCSAPADTWMAVRSFIVAEMLYGSSTGVSWSGVLPLSPLRAVSSPYPRRPEPPVPKQMILPSSSSTQVCSSPQVTCTAVRPGGGATMGREPGVCASPMSAAAPEPRRPEPPEPQQTSPPRHI